MLHPPLLIHFHGRKNRVVDRLLGPKPGSPLFSAIDEHLLPSPTPLIPLDLRRGADRCRPQTVTLPSGIVPSPKFSFYCLTSRAHGGRLGGKRGTKSAELSRGALLPSFHASRELPFFRRVETFFDRGPLRCPRRFYCFSILAATFQPEELRFLVGDSWGVRMG